MTVTTSNAFWFIVGCDYEVIVFKSREDAEAALAELDNSTYYYAIFKGEYGKEFRAVLAALEAKP